MKSFILSVLLLMVLSINISISNNSFFEEINKPPILNKTLPEKSRYIEINKFFFKEWDPKYHHFFDIENFPLPNNQNISIHVERFHIFSESSTFLENGKDLIEIPKSILLRGNIKGKTNSHVFLSIFENYVFGYINIEKEDINELYLISPLSIEPDRPSAMVIFDSRFSNHTNQWFCHSESLPQYQENLFKNINTNFQRKDSKNNHNNNLRTAYSFSLAVDCDYEFYAIFNDATNAKNYATTVLASANDIYLRDVGVSYEVTYLNVWTSTDPYPGDNADSLLYQVQRYWRQNRTSVQRAAAMLLSGFGSGIGGIAFVNSFCNNNNAYSVCGVNCDYSFPDDGWFWDIDVVAHELGHNIGSPHTNSCTWNPPIDSCAAAEEGNCFSGTVSTRGTIMSYCPYYLRFHPDVSSLLQSRVAESNCNFSVDIPIANAGSDKIICKGEGVSIGEDAAGGTPPYNYTWRPSAGLSSTSASNPTASPTSTTSYIVTVSDANSHRTFDTVIVTVNPLPQPAYNGNLSVCTTNNETYTSKYTTGNSYFWSINGGTINNSATDTSIQVSWGTPGNGWLRLVQTITSTGCTDSITKSIIINSLPAPSISGMDTVCANNVYTYSSNQTTDLSNQWFVTDGTINGSSTAKNVQVKWGKTGFGNIKLIQKVISTGCKDSTNKNIVINPLPNPTISGNFTVCASNKYEYTTDNNSTITNQWIVTGGTINGSSNGNNVSITWNKTGNGILKLIQTITATGCKDTLTKDIKINQLPISSILGNESVCAFNISTYSTPQNAGTNNLWIVSGGNIIGSVTSDKVSILWDNIGSGKIKLIRTIIESGCSDSSSKNITIHPLPEPKIIGANVICSNYTEIYNSNINNLLNYRWVVTSGTIVGDSNLSIVKVKWGLPGKGLLKLIQTNKNTGCKDSTTLDITITDKPVVTITGNFSVCEKSDETYTTSSSTELTSHWEVTGGTINGSADSSNLNVEWGNAGTGNVKLVQTMISSSVKDSTEQKIIINSLPSQPLISRRGDTLISSYDTGNQWLYKGEKIQGAVNKEYVPADEGEYTVQVTDSNNCTSGTSQPSDFSFVNWHAVNNGLKEMSIWYIGYFDNWLFVSTTNGGLYASDDFGLNWSLSNTGIEYIIGKGGGIQGAGEIKSMTSINNKLLAGSSSGGAYISTDMGKSWKTSNDGITKADIWTILPKDNDVYCGTSSGGIFASTNSGAKWVEKSSGIPNSDVSCLATIGNNLFAGMLDGGVFTSSNGGNTWIAINNGMTNPRISSLNAMDNDLLAGTWGSGVFASYDMGANWKAINQGLSNLEIYTLTSKDNNILAGTNGNGVYLSMDRGSIWNDKSEGLIEKEIRTIAIAGDYVFAGTWGGGVYRIRLADLIVGVKEIKVFESCCLRIVPNPTDKMINIYYKLPEQGCISLRIINSLGMLIYNEIGINSETSQEQVLSITASGLSDGIYFCLITGRQSILSEKFIIMK